MDVEMLKEFFMWCAILNGGMMIVWLVMITLAPNFVYRTQKRWFPLAREQFDVVMYLFLAVFKIFVIVFNLAPFIALCIIT